MFINYEPLPKYSYDPDRSITANTLRWLGLNKIVMTEKHQCANRRRAVRNLITGEVYPSVNQAFVDTGESPSKITFHCQGKIRHRRWEYVL